MQYGKEWTQARIWTLNGFPIGHLINTLRSRQNGRHFPDDIFKWIFLNGNVSISIKIPLYFIPKSPINNIPALAHIMAWRRPGDVPLSEPMMVSLLTHICVTRPQWFNGHLFNECGQPNSLMLSNCFSVSISIIFDDLSEVQWYWNCFTVH